ncbi:hypothetical protein O6H91_01G100900 [Diphasiastrum complanatum]|uniref:Uncharacterized protein n=1 Tax=Diphasiastrum complanatum TaxID=34168 RepID=A0ACC2EU83_DIPCM|nr:hypothetical protein O6H91_01G100900 [Diphasiastrum complanatum]
MIFTDVTWIFILSTGHETCLITSRMDITITAGKSGGDNFVNESARSDTNSNFTSVVHHGLIEIRRFKCLSSSQPLCKRPRHVNGRSNISSSEVEHGTVSSECDANVSAQSPHTSLKNDDRSEHPSLGGFGEHNQTSGSHGKRILVRLTSLEKLETTDCYDYEGRLSATAHERKGSSSNEGVSINQDNAEQDAVPTASSSTFFYSADVAYTSIDACESQSQSEKSGFLEIKEELAVLDMERKYSGFVAGSSATHSTNGCDCFGDGDCPPHGMVSVCGLRREMEDAVAAVPSFLSTRRDVAGACDYCSSQGSEEISVLHFFGVYDGHGGPQAALFCKDYLHHALAEEMRMLVDSNPGSGCFSKDWNIYWQKALASCFLKMDAEVGGARCCRGLQCSRQEGNESCCAEPIAPESVGSTAVVAIVAPCQIIVGNCGDSRAVLSRGGQAIALSIDHKPDREDEMARVEAAGGRVIFWNDYRVLGVLAMSRAIGDRYLKPYIIAEPEVTCTARTPEDECLILASDGLWDVLSNEAACKIARRCLAGRRFTNTGDSLSGTTEDIPDSPAVTAAALLTKVALSKGSSDNISVVVLDLRGNKKKKT